MFILISVKLFRVEPMANFEVFQSTNGMALPREGPCQWAINFRGMRKVFEKGILSNLIKALPEPMKVWKLIILLAYPYKQVRIASRIKNIIKL